MPDILIRAIDIFFRLLSYLILARVVISWLPIKKDNILFKLIFSLTEPILGPIRKLIFKSPLGGPGMMLDFSPIIAYLLLEVLRAVLISLISGLR